MVQDDISSSLTSPAMSLSPPTPSPRSPWRRELTSDERGLCLVHLLLNCANHLAASGGGFGCLDRANALLEQIALLAAPDGDAMQRIASHFAEALARRAIRPWTGLRRALDSSCVRAPAAVRLAESAAVRRHFLDFCPFLRVSFIIANQAILEAMEGEKVVHILDLDASDPTQWVALFQGLVSRPEGPPHLRITGVHENRETLSRTAARLAEEAERLDIPFQFNPVVSKLEDLDVESLRVKTGEALAVSSVLRLHGMLADEDAMPVAAAKLAPEERTVGEFLQKDCRVPNGYTPSSESAVVSPPFTLARTSTLERFLGAVWGLSPKIMVVTEHESNHNARALNERFMEALFYYAALFDCLDSTVPKQSMERLRVEKMLFGEEIKNIVACEGTERWARHEKIERWARRLDAAGFARVPLSYFGLLQARRLLQTFRCEGYQVNEEGGCFTICWQERPLFAVSAWRCKRFD